MIGVTPLRTGSRATGAGKGVRGAIQASLPALSGLRALRRLALTGSVALLVISATTFARGEMPERALTRAYVGNPQLSAGRAGVGATDETVTQAQTGYHPTVSTLADTGVAYGQGNLAGGIWHQASLPGAAGITVNQTLSDGLQRDNDSWEAESTVYSQRETLRLIELITLFSAAQAYLDIVRDTADLKLQRNTVEMLEEDLRQPRGRFDVGKVSRTDVALAEARLSGARSQAARPGRRCTPRSAPIGHHRHRASSPPTGSSTATSWQASIPRPRSVSRVTPRSGHRCSPSMPHGRG